MKFLFSLILTVIFAFSVQSQSYAPLLTNSGDTVVNTATVTLGGLKVPNAASSVSVQVVNTKISGTVAGKSYFQASNDGTTWVKLDSLTNTNQTTNSKIFVDAPAKYLWYQVSNTGSGTMSYRTYGYGLIRKH